MSIYFKYLVVFLIWSTEVFPKQMLGIFYTPTQKKLAETSKEWVLKKYNIPDKWIELIETSDCRFESSLYDFSFCLEERGEIRVIDFPPYKAKYFWKTFVISRSQDE